MSDQSPQPNNESHGSQNSKISSEIKALGTVFQSLSDTIKQNPTKVENHIHPEPDKYQRISNRIAIFALVFSVLLSGISAYFAHDAVVEARIATDSASAANRRSDSFTRESLGLSRSATDSAAAASRNSDSLNREALRLSSAAIRQQSNQFRLENQPYLQMDFVRLDTVGPKDAPRPILRYTYNIINLGKYPAKIISHKNLMEFTAIFEKPKPLDIIEIDAKSLTDLTGKLIVFDRPVEASFETFHPLKPFDDAFASRGYSWEFNNGNAAIDIVCTILYQNQITKEQKKYSCRYRFTNTLEKAPVMLGADDDK